MKNNKKIGFWYGFNLAALILIFCFLAFAPLVHAFIFASKTVGVFIHQESRIDSFAPLAFAINITNPNTQPLNAAEFEIHYDPTALLVTDIIPQSTLCEERFIISKIIDPTTGTILFQCGTIIPFSQATGTLAVIHAFPLTISTTSMYFGTTTHVLAHDGFGTDLTATTTGYTFSTL